VAHELLRRCGREVGGVSSHGPPAPQSAASSRSAPETVEAEGRRRGRKRGGSRGGKSRIERLSAQRKAIWRERNPRRFGAAPEPILMEDELRARDATRQVRTQRIADELSKAYIDKVNREGAAVSGCDPFRARTWRPSGWRSERQSPRKLS
jgi:hypothetical protein